MTGMTQLNIAISRVSVREAARAIAANLAAAGNRFTEGNKTYTVSQAASVTTLKAGDHVLASYSSTNAGADLLTIVGFGLDPKSNSGWHVAGKGKIFPTLAAAKAGLGNTVWPDICLFTHDGITSVDESKADCYFYRNAGGRFCRGSGAEPLTFRRLEG